MSHTCTTNNDTKATQNNAVRHKTESVEIILSLKSKDVDSVCVAGAGKV